MVGISLNNIPCVDPKEIRDYCVENGLPTSWYGKPNKYVCPLGAEPGYGHLLFEESDYKQLISTTAAYTLRMQSQNGNRKFTGILVAGFPKNLTPGKKNPILMVEITDTRSNALKATNTRYGWRSSPSSTTATNAMTWIAAAEDLWNKNQFSQEFPGLPEDAHGLTLDLEQYDCHGFKVISALEDLLQALGCVLTYDPTIDSYSINYAAGDIEDIVAFATKYRDALIYSDIEYDRNPYFNYPDTVRVLFPVWSEDSATDPRMVYAKDVTLDLSTVFGGSKGGALILQDKQPLRIDSSGTILNQTTIDGRAAAVAATFQDRMSATTCKWPISRAYRGFIGGGEDDGQPGVNFDLIAWMDIGEGPMTAFLRQGIAGTGELYDTASLPTAGLIVTDHNPTMLYENGVAKRAMGLQPAQSRAKQNEGWWDDPTRDVIRLVGSGLGPYMMRTQSLRYGEYAQVSTGGRNDLRGRLYRPWVDAADLSGGGGTPDKVRFCWVLGPDGLASSTYGASIYAAYLMNQDNAAPTSWSIDGLCYIGGANNETLVTGLKYMSHKVDPSVTCIGDLGQKELYNTYCCDGTPTPPPVYTSCGSTAFYIKKDIVVNFDSMGATCTDSLFNYWYTTSQTLSYVGQIGVDGVTCASVLALAQARYDAMYPGSGILTDSCGFIDAINVGVQPWCGSGVIRHVWMSATPVAFPPRASGSLSQVLIAVTWGYGGLDDCFMDVFNVGIHGPFGCGFYTGGGGISCTRHPGGGPRMEINPANTNFISNIFFCTGSLVCSPSPTDFFRINIRNA